MPILIEAPFHPNLNEPIVGFLYLLVENSYSIDLRYVVCHSRN